MDIFIVEISDTDNIDEGLLAQFCHKKFSNDKKRLEHCFSYLMTDRILKEVYKIENREIVFEGTKPFLKSKDKYFSISHSGEYIALCFSDYDCGIDIEKITKRDFKPVSDRMGFGSDSIEDFYIKWTKYESEYKLGIKSKAYKKFFYNNYSVTAVSENPSELFNIYIQNGNSIPNSET